MIDTPAARKSLGQHWLYDKASLEAMCQAADLKAEDVVLEIGPGLGTLTVLLVKRAAKVIVVEFDTLLAATLPVRVPAANLNVVQQDILSFDFQSLPAGYKVVANIPYYLTSNLIRVLSESTNPAERAVLLVQKEVAERVAAPVGALSILGVSAQFYWEVSLGQIVPAKLFSPAPKVDSQILVLRRRDQPLFSDVNPKVFFQLVKAGFGSKRKTLNNSLSGGLGKPKSEILELLNAAGIDPGLRAQNLTLADWHSLYKVWTGTSHSPAPQDA